MRTILAFALVCGFGVLPEMTEAKEKVVRRDHRTGSHFVYVAHGRHYRFDRCHVRGRDCYRYYWAARRCYVYWWPGSTCYYTLNETGFVPVTTGVLPATGPIAPLTGVADTALPPVPTGIPGIVDGAAVPR